MKEVTVAHESFEALMGTDPALEVFNAIGSILAGIYNLVKGFIVAVFNGIKSLFKAIVTRGRGNKAADKKNGKTLTVIEKLYDSKTINKVIGKANSGEVLVTLKAISIDSLDSPTYPDGPSGDFSGYFNYDIYHDNNILGEDVLIRAGLSKDLGKLASDIFDNLAKGKETSSLIDDANDLMSKIKALPVFQSTQVTRSANVVSLFQNQVSPGTAKDFLARATGYKYATSTEVGISDAAMGAIESGLSKMAKNLTVTNDKLKLLMANPPSDISQDEVNVISNAVINYISALTDNKMAIDDYVSTITMNTENYHRNVSIILAKFMTLAKSVGKSTESSNMAEQLLSVYDSLIPLHRLKAGLEREVSNADKVYPKVNGIYDELMYKAKSTGNTDRVRSLEENRIVGGVTVRSDVVGLKEEISSEQLALDDLLHDIEHEVSVALSVVTNDGTSLESLLEQHEYRTETEAVDHDTQTRIVNVEVPSTESSHVFKSDLIPLTNLSDLMPRNNSLETISDGMLLCVDNVESLEEDYDKQEVFTRAMENMKLLIVEANQVSTNLEDIATEVTRAKYKTLA